VKHAVDAVEFMGITVDNRLVVLLESTSDRTF
jgi:hypothetical protein